MWGKGEDKEEEKEDPEACLSIKRDFYDYYLEGAINKANPLRLQYIIATITKEVRLELRK